MKRLIELIKLFPRASRLPFLVASLIPVGLATALAYTEQGAFSVSRLLLVMVGMTGAHLAVNFFNDYFDYRYGVDPPHPPRPFSGGSQVIQEGLQSPAEFLGQALAMTSLALVAAVALALLSGPAVLLFSAVGAFLGFFYSARPLLLSWRGFGELTTGLCFGPLVMAGTYYVQVRDFSLASLLLSLVPGALISAVLLINQYPDHETDRLAGKRTLIVKLGPRRALPVLYLLLAIGFLPLALGSFSPWLASKGYLALIGLFPAVMAASLLSGNAANWNESNPGRLMLISYSATHLILLFSIFLVES